MTSINPNRRRFLWWTAGGLVAGGALYTYARGVRFPPLHFVDDGPVTGSTAGGVEVVADGAVFQGVEEDAFRFRASVPEPRLAIRGGDDATVIVENIHSGAQLNVERPEPAGQSAAEDRDNLTRSITIRPSDPETVLSWRFPAPEQYRFAAIGDTGGGTELHWVLERAAELGAAFLIHVGDFYYEDGDLDRASANLNAARIPTYAAIGNHDFHDDAAMYREFGRLIGPSNSIFSLGGIEFVNVDTAADFVPVARGPRARILGGLQTLGSDARVRDRVAFTHTPLRDPDPERGHAVGRPAEAQWLREALLSRGTRNLLAGHIHIKEEFDDQGLHTYITGQGLAHADLIVDRPHAEILLGDVEPGEPVGYQWQPLNMPLEAHCNRRNMRVLDALEKPELKARLLEQCGKA